ncbi:helix-turn-helix domain-containing protein [Planococcus sp. 107-1]|uniref:helix-turn-helix domain-containing protein n=1 Tax=Planococcus sp. 107-1 TaxID=2908840 RepID=UPI001F17954D|nr:helix-turn-helix transcriptional regulator [Planococcus sp. 107-1]UJF27931.1 helix-turn-helix domain-containing protein [Planococcus sp. 107-1]
MKLEVAFGIVLKRHRKLKLLSQEQLALKANLDRTYISMLERGLRQPTISTIFTLAKTLEVLPNELIKEVEELEMSD